MSANEPERSYGDLREAVMEAILDASDRGLASFAALLEKTALELAKRDGPAAGRGPACQLEPDETQLVLEIVWDMVRQGILTIGVNGSNLAAPRLKLSRFGETALRQGPNRFHNNAGFMKTLRCEAADISPDAALDLREAVTAFYTDCLLSSCVMLGMAAESEFLRLLSAAKTSKTYGRHFSRVGDGLTIGAKISQFREAINPILSLLPKSAVDELDHNLNTIETVIRTGRNESGRPSGARPPSRDQVYLYLQLFIPFARQAMRLRQELTEPAYPKLVQVH